MLEENVNQAKEIQRKTNHRIPSKIEKVGLDPVVQEKLMQMMKVEDIMRLTMMMTATRQLVKDISEQKIINQEIIRKDKKKKNQMQIRRAAKKREFGAIESFSLFWVLLSP